MAFWAVTVSKSFDADTQRHCAAKRAGQLRHWASQPRFPMLGARKCKRPIGSKWCAVLSNRLFNTDAVRQAFASFPALSHGVG